MCEDCLKRKAQCEAKGKAFYLCRWCWAKQQGFIPQWWEKARCIDEAQTDLLAKAGAGLPHEV